MLEMKVKHRRASPKKHERSSPVNGLHYTSSSSTKSDDALRQELWTLQLRSFVYILYHVQQLHCTTFYIIPPYIAMFQVPYILLPCASRSLIYFPCKQGFHIPHLHNTLISCSSPPPPTSFTYSHHTAHFATWAFHVREPFACFLHMNSMSQVWAPRGGGVFRVFTYVLHSAIVSESFFYIFLICASKLPCALTYSFHVHAATGGGKTATGFRASDIRNPCLL